MNVAPRPPTVPASRIAGPAPLLPPSAGPFAARVAEALRSWARRRAWRRTPADAAIDKLSAVVAEAGGPGEVEAALVRLAYEGAGPGVHRVELRRGRPDREIAAWPEGDGDGGRSGPGLATVEIPLRCRGRSLGTLRVATETPDALGPVRRRRLATLATLAAAAEIGPTEPEIRSMVDPETRSAHDPATGLLNSAFFAAFFSYAVALTARRSESISLLCLGVDRVAAIRDLHGPALADEAVRTVGRVVAANLRSSDLVARLDDGRIAAVLLNTPADGALVVAEAIRVAVVEAGAATDRMPVLTASIGVATFPDHAADADALLRAATLAHATALVAPTRDRIVAAPPIGPRLRLVQHAG